MDDTFTFAKEESITFALEQLNSYHPNLQFTYELENVGNNSFFLIFWSLEKVIKNLKKLCTVNTQIRRFF